MSLGRPFWLAIRYFRPTSSSSKVRDPLIVKSIRESRESLTREHRQSTLSFLRMR